MNAVWVGGASPSCMCHWRRGPLVTHSALRYEKHNTANTCSVLFTYVCVKKQSEKQTGTGTATTQTRLLRSVIFAHPWHKKGM